ncbi:MAG: CYTH domain-containing protein [Burkholderiaceae bacterium]|nr:CYTH domain-containing protein [Burkholderiaceae bacterium]
MGVEIERKFLVSSDAWRGLGQVTFLRQAYLSAEPERTVRVRIEGVCAFLTIKSASVGISRGEWEYPIPLLDAQELLDKVCMQPSIEKNRHRIEFAGLVWEVDEFFGENAGLVVAEVELESESQLFECPGWLGEEVSDDKRYANSNLMRHPYSQWGNRG